MKMLVIKLPVKKIGRENLKSMFVKNKQENYQNKGGLPNTLYLCLLMSKEYIRDPKKFMC